MEREEGPAGPAGPPPALSSVQKSTARCDDRGPSPGHTPGEGAWPASSSARHRTPVLSPPCSPQWLVLSPRRQARPRPRQTGPFLQLLVGLARTSPGMTNCPFDYCERSSLLLCHSLGAGATQQHCCHSQLEDREAQACRDQPSHPGSHSRQLSEWRADPGVPGLSCLDRARWGRAVLVQAGTAPQPLQGHLLSEGWAGTHGGPEPWET